MNVVIRLSVISMLALTGCTIRPSNGISDGQKVYLRASCHKAMVREWNSFIGMYSIINQDGTHGFVMANEVSANRSDCINWEAP